MNPDTIHPNDCGNCKHWKPWTDDDLEKHCQVYESFGRKRPETRYNFGWCDKIPKWTVYCKEGYTYDGYSFSDECYDEDLHCFEAGETGCLICDRRQCRSQILWTGGEM